LTIVWQANREAGGQAGRQGERMEMSGKLCKLKLMGNWIGWDELDDR
jgi:hypothetical protein